MADLNHLDNSEVLDESNDQDLHIEEEINNQLDNVDEDEGQDVASLDDDSEDAEDSDDGKPTPEDRRKHAFKKQKDKLKAERLENQRLRAELATLRKQTPKDPMSKYDRSKYTDAQWRNLEIRESVKAELAQENLARQEAQIEAQEDNIYQEEFQMKKEELIKNGASDYDEVIKSVEDVMIPPPAVEMIQESDNPPALTYYLAKNRDQAERLASMTPNQIRNYLTKVEVRLEMQAEQKAQVSKANATPKKGGKSGSTQKDRSKMDMKQYAEDYRKRRSNHGKR